MDAMQQYRFRRINPDIPFPFRGRTIMQYSTLFTLSIVMLFASLAGTGLAICAWYATAYPASVIGVGAATFLGTVTNGRRGGQIASLPSVSVDEYLFEAPESIHSRLTIESMGTIFDVESLFTRYGNMRFLQLILQSRTPGTAATGWIDVPLATVGMDRAFDRDSMTHRSSSRQQCYIRTGNTWWHGLFSFGGTFRMGRVNPSVSGDGYLYAVAGLTAGMAVNKTISMPSIFYSWPVSIPSPLGRHVINVVS